MLDESSDTDPLIIKDIRRKMSSRFKLDLEPRKLKELLLDLQTFLDNVPETKLGELRSELKDKNVEQHGSYWYLIPPFEPWLVNYISLLIPRGSYLKPKQLKEIWRSIASLGGLNAKNLEIWSDIPQEKDKDTLVNKELPFIVDQLLHAIKNHYWVSFSLGEFDLNMQHVADTKKDGSEKSPSIKYPLKVISRNGKFFLLARFPNSSKVYHFSLEHIMDLSVIDDPNQLGSIDDSNFKSTELEYITDNDSYGETHLYMYSEPTTEIIIRVVNKRSARNDSLMPLDARQSSSVTRAVFSLHR